MILDMDSVRFESRVEIGAIIQALEEWQAMKNTKADKEIVKDMIEKLDVMEMSW